MNSQGFTLIELLIVIAIIGILAVLGIMNYARWRASSAVMEGAVQFAQAVNATRTGAKRANACWQIALVNYGTANTQYQIERYEGSSCSGSLSQPTLTYSLPPQVEIKIHPGFATNANNAKVFFSPPHSTTNGFVKQFLVYWKSNEAISHTVRATGVFGKVIVK